MLRLELPTIIAEVSPIQPNIQLFFHALQYLFTIDMAF